MSHEHRRSKAAARRRRARTCTRWAALAACALLALPAAAAAHLRIAHAGKLRAGVAPCSPGQFTGCGGSVEINGQEYGFGGGGLSGRVSSSGRASSLSVSFGAAQTDPAVQGPFQLTLALVAPGRGSGGFRSAGSPLGVGGRTGLDFDYHTAFYIHLTGADPEGASVGASCTIGSPSALIQASFQPTLAGFFGTPDAGVAYDQASGIAQLTANALQYPGAQGCDGQEATLDEQLGLPGPGSVEEILRFAPKVQSTAYRHRHR